MKTQVNAQSTPVFGSWWENVNPDFRRDQKPFFDRIDRYMDEFGSIYAIETLNTLLEHYLHVETQVCYQTDPKEIAKVAVNTASLMAFMSSLQYQYQTLRSVPFIEAKPVEPAANTGNSSSLYTLQLGIDFLKNELKELEKQNSVTQAQDLKDLITELISLRTQAGEHIELEHLQKASELVRSHRQAYAVKESDPQEEENYLTPLEQAIDEVWAGYRDVKRRFNIEDEYIKGRLCVWAGLIEEFAGLTGFINPDDHGWQKMLDNFREEYQALISK